MTDTDVSTPSGGAAPVTDQLLTIGDLESRTGVPSATIRAWERRIGFPEPIRSPGGQRRYRESDVALVQQVQAERSRGQSLSAAVAGARRGESVGEGSMFALLRARHPGLDVLQVSFKVMRALTSAIEDECLAHASAPLLFGGFQNRRSFENSGARWRELARRSVGAVVFADFPTTDAGDRPARVALPPDSPLLNEWSLVCDDPRLGVVLAAWEPPRVRDSGPRRFEALLSLDPDVVRDAAHFCIDTARGGGLAEADHLSAHLAVGNTEDPRRTASLLRRFALYADG